MIVRVRTTSGYPGLPKGMRSPRPIMPTQDEIAEYGVGLAEAPAPCPLEGYDVLELTHYPMLCETDLAAAAGWGRSPARAFWSEYMADPLGVLG